MVYNPQSIGCQCLHGTLTTQLVDAIRTTARGVSIRQNAETEARLAGTAVDADPLHGVIKIVGSAPEHEAAPDALLSDADKLMPCNAPVAAAFPVAPPVGADRLICDSTPFATVPAPENAVPVGGAIDSPEIAPLATQAPTAVPVGADKALVGRLALAVAAPAADPAGADSDNSAMLPPVVADPVAAPVGEESEAVGRAALAVAVPVADPVAADSESDGRVPLADADPEAADSMGNAPISACEPSKKKRLYELYISGHDYTQLDSDYWVSAACHKGEQRRKARSLQDLGYSAARQKHLPCRRTINTFGTSPTEHRDRLEQQHPEISSGSRRSGKRKPLDRSDPRIAILQTKNEDHPSGS